MKKAHKRLIIFAYTFNFVHKNLYEHNFFPCGTFLLMVHLKNKRYTQKVGSLLYKKYLDFKFSQTHAKAGQVYLHLLHIQIQSGFT